jgi:hypothetical protein
MSRPSNRELLDKLEIVLNSGDTQAARLVKANIQAIFERLQPDTPGPKLSLVSGGHGSPRKEIAQRGKALGDQKTDGRQYQSISKLRRSPKNVESAR